jgi:hypothetical protein
MILLIFLSERSTCAALMRCSSNVVSTIFGIIGTRKVCALPLDVAAERSIHYFVDFFGQINLQSEGVTLGHCSGI